MWDQWWLRSPEASPTGKTRELFLTRGDVVLYAGTYNILSLRHVHPPGSPAPSEVSKRQLALHAGLTDNSKTDPMALRTECFGLQRVGFDEELYRNLQEGKRRVWWKLLEPEEEEESRTTRTARTTKRMRI
ncbi:hypothetical protein B0H12DRAFT_1117890, partial [Mycena haematopus]